MILRHAVRTAAVAAAGCAVAILVTACGPSGSGSAGGSSASAAGSSASATGAASSATVPSASATTPTTAAAPDNPANPTASTAVGNGRSGGSGSSSGTQAGGARKPCYHPAGYAFLKFDGAEPHQGGALIRYTPVACSVSTTNDEDVHYTPSGSSGSAYVQSGSRVMVYDSDMHLKNIGAEGLADYRLLGTPYFFYKLNSQGRFVSLQEIYHP